MNEENRICRALGALPIFTPAHAWEKDDAAAVGSEEGVVKYFPFHYNLLSLP